MEQKKVTEWIISGNPKKYRVVDAFRELHRIDWGQNANMVAGDIAYIYVSGDVGAIRLKCRVNRVELKEPDIDDHEYYLIDEYDENAGKYMELELLEEFEGVEYSRIELEKHGFKSPRRPVRMPDSVKDYLESVKERGKAAIAEKYGPSLSEYDPGITAAEYERILGDENIVKRAWLDMIYYLYFMGGTGTCKQIANRHGNGAAHYNTNAINIAKAVHRETNCPLSTRETGERQFWPVLFLGRALPADSDGAFCYKMREPLMEAVRALERRGVFREMEEEKSREFGKNLILYGPPGTGKTYSSVIYAVAICDGISVENLTDYDAVLARYNELREAGRISFTTFHQSYGYEEFIEGIKPVVDNKAADISYKVEPGVFKKFCDAAGTPERVGEAHVFIIDEINRGNISRIFGELITLIEVSKRDGMKEAASAILPYSGKPFSVPSNVYMLGTMNTADRSIALIDTALRRRFQFIEMMPDSAVLRKIHADRVEDLDVAAMLDKINERISFLYDREHTIGHAFFTGLRGERATLDNLKVIFEKSVIPLLQEYFYEDYQKIQLVLGDNAKSSDDLKFIRDEKVAAKNIFKGSVEDAADLPEKRFTINKTAFGNINSYKEIL